MLTCEKFKVSFEKNINETQKIMKELWNNLQTFYENCGMTGQFKNFCENLVKILRKF